MFLSLCNFYENESTYSSPIKLQFNSNSRDDKFESCESADQRYSVPYELIWFTFSFNWRDSNFLSWFNAAERNSTPSSPI